MRHAVSVDSVNAAPRGGIRPGRHARARSPRERRPTPPSCPAGARQGCRTEGTVAARRRGSRSSVRSLMPGLINTVSPTATFVTPSPISSTTPIASRAEDPRRSDAHVREPGDDEQVEVVERGGNDPHAHLCVRRERRHRQIVAQLDAIEPAVGRDGESSHASGRGLYWSAECYVGVVRRERRAPPLRFASRRALMTAIKVPPLGESIVEATVSRWLKKEGEAVAAGDTLVELETDKITVEVPALAAGVLAKRARNEGDVVKVDELLGELTEGAGASGAGRRLPRRQQRRRHHHRPLRRAPAARRPCASRRVAGPCVARGAARRRGAACGPRCRRRDGSRRCGEQARCHRARRRRGSARAGCHARSASTRSVSTCAVAPPRRSAPRLPPASARRARR